MKVLIVGSGGREHAIAWSVAKSPKVDKIYCAPGNAGISEYAECVDIGAMEFEKLADFAEKNSVDLTIIGMDDPLVGGVVDVFETRGLKVFGPRKNAAILEGSKAFSKDLMKKYGIPTAGYENFDDPQKALDYLHTQVKFPIVLKADGLALGKGVLICNTLEEAEAGVKEIMEDKKFGSAGNTMVIEEFMTGREVSVLSFVDGKTIRPMTSAQDHKRAKDGDQGLNTGGMGTFSPSPFYTEEVDKFCKEHIYQATVDAMAAEGRPFTGIIFFGLMLTADGPKVLEYNARFGDPEAQVVLPRMKNDIIDVFEACIDGTLDKIDLEFEDNAAVCVVLASDGYPEKYEKGKIIYSTSVTDLIKDESGRVVGFHAKGENGASYTLRGKAVCLASGGFAKNPEMLKKYSPDYADFFFNCASSMTGEGIQMGIDAGGYVECENRALPAFLSSYKSKFELAFIHQSAPGIMVNIKGDNIGNIVSDNHYTMAKAKLNKDNGDTFYYVFDESSAVKLRDSEAYGFNGYVAMFEKGEAVHYDSVEKASEELNLPNLADAIEANNAAALAGEPDEFGRRNCPYIETRDGLWAIRVDPTFYLTTAGLAIDTDCHVLTEDKKAIPGLYAAGDVCGSIEEKDAKQYGMGFDAALTYGYIMGETLKKEI